MNRLFVFLVMIFIGLFFDRFNIFKIYIISTILHEAGHIVTYRIFSDKWPDIDISVFGYKMKNNVIFNKNYIYILMAGTMVNLTIVVVTLLLLKFNISFSVYLCLYVNLVIFIFNILPVYFLDGGQVLYHLSGFYQRNYVIISTIVIVFISVMVYTFTSETFSFLFFVVYFIVNTLNDI